MPRRPMICPILPLVAAGIALHLAGPGPAAAQQMPATVASVDAAPAAVAADSKREPVLSGVLSAVIIGAGQAYNGEWVKAGLFFGGGIILGGGTLAAASNDDCEFGDSCGLAIGLGVAWLGLYVYNIVDAVLSAQRINRSLGVAGLQLHPSVALRESGHRPTLDAVRVPTQHLEVSLGRLRF